MITRRFRGSILVVAACLPLAAACSSGSSGRTEAAPTTSIRASTTTPTPAPTGALPDAVQSSLQQAVDQTMATYGAPAAVVGVYVPGHGSWVTATGVADRETGAAATTEMIWPLRSVTKSFAVTLVLQLVDDGKLSLDDTIDRYVDGVPNGSSITIRELAAMTSGAPDYTTQQFITDFSADPNRVFTLAELNGYALSQPAQFEPGARHVYTNTNTNLLGAVVEKVTGQPFSEVLAARILQPLGLQHSNYLTSPEQRVVPHATGYEPTDGVLESQPDNFSIFGPSGAMVSNLEDQRVWAEALATGSLLAPATQAERVVGAPLDKGPDYDRYALGIGEVDGWWGHTGEGFGFTALTMHDDDTGATVVIFMNIAKPEPSGHPPTELFRKIAAILAHSS